MTDGFDIARIAQLARIALDEDELEAYANELDDILTHARRVQALPTDDVPPTSHPLPMTNAFRADEVAPSLDRDEVLSQAPDAVEGYFRVPRIMESNGDGGSST